MADTLNLEAERASFEARLPEHWSREMKADDEGDIVYVDDLTAGAFGGWLMARRSTSSVSEGEMPPEAQTAYKVAKGALIFGYYSERSDAEAIARQYAGAEVRVMVELAATKAAAPADRRTVAVPVEAYLWLMGLGRDAFTEDRNGAFWWRGAFNDRAGLDMMAIYQASKGRAPAEDAREEVQDERSQFENYFCMTLSDDDNESPELLEACRSAAYDAWMERARRATSVPAIPGTGREKEEGNG